MSVNLQAIGLSGIAAAEAAMAAVESNITNASNPSYSSESVGFQTTMGSNGGGNGVAVLQTTRAEAPMLSQQINSSQNTQSYDQAFSQVTGAAQQILAPASGDLSSALQNVFNAFTALSAQPQDATTRTAALSAINQFAQTDQNVVRLVLDRNEPIRERQSSSLANQRGQHPNRPAQRRDHLGASQRPDRGPAARPARCGGKSACKPDRRDQRCERQRVGRWSAAGIGNLCADVVGYGFRLGDRAVGLAGAGEFASQRHPDRRAVGRRHGGRAEYLELANAGGQLRADGRIGTQQSKHQRLRSRWDY